MEEMKSDLRKWCLFEGKCGISIRTMQKKKILKMNMYQVETSRETSDTGFMGDAP